MLAWRGSQMQPHWLMMSLSLVLVAGCATTPAAPAPKAPPAATTNPAPAATSASAPASGSVPKIAANANESLKGKEIKIGVLTSTEGVAWAPSAKRQDQAIQI